MLFNIDELTVEAMKDYNGAEAFGIWVDWLQDNKVIPEEEIAVLRSREHLIPIWVCGRRVNPGGINPVNRIETWKCFNYLHHRCGDSAGSYDLLFELMEDKLQLRLCACCKAGLQLKGDAEKRCQDCVLNGLTRDRRGGWRQLGVYDG